MIKKKYKEPNFSISLSAKTLTLYCPCIRLDFCSKPKRTNNVQQGKVKKGIQFVMTNEQSYQPTYTYSHNQQNKGKL